ncbi:chemotaxis protein [Bryobacterales bacterium F-183]|nr:chemotaxis protein [Bryobacterales bacterium F-183]
MARTKTTPSPAVDFAALTLDSLGVNVFIADADLKLTYMNRRAADTLAGISSVLESKFGLRHDQVLGKPIDLFHGSRAAEIRARLLNPRSYPLHTEIRFGGLVLDLNATMLQGPNGEMVGLAVSWEEISAKKTLQAEMEGIKQMVENAPVNIMRCNRDLVIDYMNPASVQTLRTLEHLLPVKADQVVGQSIDIFHKNPAHQRTMLANPANLPHRAKIKLGPEILELLVSPMYDADRNYLGPMVTWETITAREAAKERDSIMRQVTEITTSLAESATSLKQISQELTDTAGGTAVKASLASTSSQRVAHNVEIVSDGSQQMLISIKDIAQNSAEAARIARAAVEMAQNTNATMTKLGQSSVEIGKVIKVISAIAQQTNLLALNASIEAARAGEAGKGFAVVANEVKELAKKTAAATEEIGDQVQAIQNDSRRAVDAIVEVGNIISQINDVSNIIAAAVEEQTATTNEISHNIAEAASGTNEITGNVAGLASAANITSERAAETLRAADSLSQLSAQLGEVIQEFKRLGSN